MNIFSQLWNRLLNGGAKAKDFEGPIPGAMGKLLSQMGINEIGPHRASGTPLNVLMGCKPALTVVPGTDTPARTKEGKPVLAKNKAGRVYQVMDQYAIPTKRWKQMQRDQQRREAGRYFNGETDAQRDARRAKVA